jgi:hypothetical protein
MSEHYVTTEVATSRFIQFRCEPFGVSVCHGSRDINNLLIPEMMSGRPYYGAVLTDAWVDKA